MVLIEQLCYKLSNRLGDVILFDVCPMSVAVYAKCANKFNKSSSRVALKERTIEAISNNLFDCLDYID